MPITHVFSIYLLIFCRNTRAYHLLYKNVSKQDGCGYLLLDRIRFPSQFLDTKNYSSETILIYMQDAHSPFPFMSVPKVLSHLTQKRVLTMEWMVGESPSDLIYLSSKSPAPKGENNIDREQNDARRRLLDLVSNYK